MRKESGEENTLEGRESDKGRTKNNTQKTRNGEQKRRKK